MTRILQELCSLPTAPFLEGRVVEYVKQFVAARKKLRLTHDEHGNLLVSLPGKSKAVARWIFTAHMDHPGLISGKMIDKHTVECELRGWVLAELMKGAKVRFFSGGKEIRGEILDVVRAIEEFAASPRPGEVYNLGRGRSVRIADVVDDATVRVRFKTPLLHTCTSSDLPLRRSINL